MLHRTNSHGYVFLGILILGLMKFYARLVIIYIAIFCIFASKFAGKAFVHRRKTIDIYGENQKFLHYCSHRPW